MSLKIVSFTKSGAEIANRIAQEIPGCEVFANRKFAEDFKVKALDVPIADWTKKSFSSGSDIVFVGAVGIAVRAIAPHLKSKTEDPAVIVIDERGNYVIPLVSGHIGGANALALKLSEIINAVPVITTATDINRVFAVDSWAVQNGFHINNPENIKHISSALLEGEPVGLYSDIPISGEIPAGIRKTENSSVGIVVSHELKKIYQKTLNLVPKDIYLGIGSRKGTDSEKLEKFVLDTLKEQKIEIERVLGVCSIDIKKQEKAITDFSRKYNLKNSWFTAEQLNSVPGEFTGSDFVKKTVGVDNVCERACMKRGDELLLSKTSFEGITIAISRKERCVDFESCNGRN